jgi:acetyl-CoA C-acetyltransferase
MLGFVDSASAGVDPNLLGIGPVASTRKLLKRQPALRLADINAIEFNEAFAAQVLASLDQLDIDPARVNRDGGAIALGHPWGASGAVLAVRLFAQLVRQGRGGSGLTALSAGGGLGVAALWQAVGPDGEPVPPGGAR